VSTALNRWRRLMTEALSIVVMMPESVLRQTARQHIQKGISRTFVLTDSEQPETILGFLPIAVKSAPNGFHQNSPKVPLNRPWGQAGGLAVAKTWQRQGIGEILMVEAMQDALDR